MRVETTAGIGAGEGARVAGLLRTPTRNETLVQRLGGFDTIWQGLDYAAGGDAGFNFHSARGDLADSLTYRELRRLALATGRRLIGAGLRRGDRVAVVAETGREFMAVFFGCQYAGLVPCPIPYSMHIGGRDAYVERIAGMLESAHACAAVTTADLDGHIREAAAKAGVALVWSHDELAGLADAAVELAPFAADEIAYIQYSSGSTSRPKGVVISQAAASANTTAILRHGLKVRPDDRAFSWLPLYHDMGLVGFCLSPMMGQVSVDYLATSAFARRPVLWLRLMAQNGCTVCYAPSFGYDLAARRVNGEAASLDLSRWRIAGIGGDMVRADVLAAFSEALAVSGFRPQAFLPSYGMAESTLGVTFFDTEQAIEVDVVDRMAMKLTGRAVPADGDLAPAERRAFVVCGRPLPGHEVKVVDEAGRSLPEREVGRIVIAGPSLMSGYFRNAEATGQVMRGDGFMDTGDMGYWRDGQLVVTGRAKDMILHNGRNIWPQDIEWAVEQIAPLRDGDVAAFAVEGADDSDDIVVLVQCRLGEPEAIEALRRQAAAAVNRTVGAESRIVMIPPRSLPFTSSGKLSRAGARALYLTGEIAEIAAEAAAVPRPQPAHLIAAE